MIKNVLNNSDAGLLIFRLSIGFTMALAHGLGKTPPPEMLVGGLESMGFPIPIFFAWCAALSELVGGLFIGVGLFTRISAGLLGFTMAVAFFVAHAADPFAKKEMAFLYLASCILLIFTGAGKYSIDRFICKKK